MQATLEWEQCLSEARKEVEAIEFSILGFSTGWPIEEKQIKPYGLHQWFTAITTIHYEKLPSYRDIHRRPKDVVYIDSYTDSDGNVL